MPAVSMVGTWCGCPPDAGTMPRRIASSGSGEEDDPDSEEEEEDDDDDDDDDEELYLARLLCAFTSLTWSLSSSSS